MNHRALPNPGSAQSVIVIGGGVAGLVAARVIALTETPVTILEGASFGGSVARRSLGGVELDTAAEGFATRGGAVVDLLTDLGLTDRVVPPEPSGTWVYRPDNPTRIPDGAVLGIPTDLHDPILRQLGDLGAQRVAQDAVLPPRVGAEADTLGALVRARMGDAVADTWVRPLISGVHRLDIDEISPELLLPGIKDRLREHGTLAAAVAGTGGQFAGLDGGMTQIVDALVGSLTSSGARLLNTGASAVEQDRESWRVRTADGAVLQADRLLLAGPPWYWPSGLPHPLVMLARDWPAPREVDVVSLVLAHDGGGRHAGVVVADGGGNVQARALTYSSAKWAWLARRTEPRVALRLTYDAGATEDDDLVRVALADAAAVSAATWTSDDLLGFHRGRWYLPRSAVEPGMADQREQMRAALDSLPAIDATGGWLAGTGLAWTVADATHAASRMTDTDRRSGS